MKRDFDCEECRTKFNSRKELEAHLKSLLTCAECDVMLHTQSALQTHIDNEHDEKSNCDSCSFVTTEEASLRMHIRDSHGAQSSNICNDCNKSFVSNTELENHKVTHHSSEDMIAINRQYFEKLMTEKENLLKENERLKETLKGYM